MAEYLNDLQASFFAWCDNTVFGHVNREGTILKYWRPRKNPDGSYDLVFELDPPDEPASKLAVPVPEQFHELLEKEYFADHGDEEEHRDNG
ncbi:hypothetical protein ACP3TJ_12275 [Desulforudis sp. 1088]|uniref:hypothetical protein n=1 Tax=unclassified Candidatus Desulforudis TaxID=2635950 RepID=UPI003491B739